MCVSPEAEGTQSEGVGRYCSRQSSLNQDGTCLLRERTQSLVHLKSLSLASLWCSCNRLHPEAKDHSPLKTLNACVHVCKHECLVPLPTLQEKNYSFEETATLERFLNTESQVTHYPSLTLQIFLLGALAWGSVAPWLDRVTTYVWFKLEAALSSLKVNLINLYINQITLLLKKRK